MTPKKNPLGIVFPRQGSRYWYHRITSADPPTGKEPRAVQELQRIRQTLVSGDSDETRFQLRQAERIAGSADARAAAADRRATTILASIPIAATLTLGAGGLILGGKLSSHAEYVEASAATVGIVSAFVFSALYALSALVATRRWSWPTPVAGWYPVPDEGAATPSLEEQRQLLTAATIRSFTYNWEVSELKNRLVDRALAWLVVALTGLLTIAIAVLVIAVQRT